MLFSVVEARLEEGCQVFQPRQEVVVPLGPGVEHVREVDQSDDGPPSQLVPVDLVPSKLPDRGSVVGKQHRARKHLVAWVFCSMSDFSLRATSKFLAVSASLRSLAATSAFHRLKHSSIFNPQVLEQQQDLLVLVCLEVLEKDLIFSGHQELSLALRSLFFDVRLSFAWPCLLNSIFRLWPRCTW